CRLCLPPVSLSFPTRRSSDLPQSSQRRGNLPRPSAGCSRGRSGCDGGIAGIRRLVGAIGKSAFGAAPPLVRADPAASRGLGQDRSEEHTSELQSREKLVCRLL